MPLSVITLDILAGDRRKRARGWHRACCGTNLGAMTTTLVIGATGRVGRRVAGRLHAAGADVRAFGRAQGGLLDQASLEAAVRGADGVYLMWPLHTATPAPAVASVLARHARRIVLLSSGSVGGGIVAAEPIARLHAAVERAVESADCAWTVLRPAGFAANSLAWAGSIRDEGVVRGAYPDAAGAWLHEDDLAAVAVAALLEDGHAGRRYAVTGPASLTMAEQAAVIGEVIGRPVRWETLSPETARARFVESGWPPELARVAMQVEAELARGPAPVTTTVADVTGRPAREYRTWVTDHAAAFQP
jgi:uncharacterized protein YbjT (DUF2867 family)